LRPKHLCYAFNFKRKDGSINDDPELFFKLTDLIYDHFHVHFYQDGKAEDIHKYRFSQPELSSSLKITGRHS